jgi:hypothetical protein
MTHWLEEAMMEDEASQLASFGCGQHEDKSKNNLIPRLLQKLGGEM